jgi:hypothetical protein
VRHSEFDRWIAAYLGQVRREPSPTVDVDLQDVIGEALQAFLARKG